MIERESSSRRERRKWLQTQQCLKQTQAAALLAPRVGAGRSGAPPGSAGPLGLRFPGLHGDTSGHEAPTVLQEVFAF